MKQDISKCQFMDAFRDMNRKDQFSYGGLSALYDYLIDYEESCDQEIELDVIALCCEYTEYENLNEFLNDYTDTLKTQRDDFEDDEEEEYRDVCMEELREHTQIIMIDEDEEGFIIQCF